MNKGLYFVMFTAGSAIGSIATWQYTKKKYEQIAQDEIESVKNTFSRIKKEHQKNAVSDEKTVDTVKQDFSETDKKDYNNLIKNNGYKNNEKESAMDNKKPYVITPDEFGEIDEYDTVSLIYYADKYLTTYDGDIIEDIEERIGFESLKHFGEYEDDTVFIRNDVLACDYEIMLDDQNFEDVFKFENSQ